MHIISMVILFGTGFGSAFYKWMADRTRNVNHMNIVNKHVVLADWIFTTPTIIFQLVSGLWLIHIAGIPWTTPWISMSLALYMLAGVCWLPVVWLQIKMLKMTKQSLEQKTKLNKTYWCYAKIWFYLGIPAFVAMLWIVMLMVKKQVEI